MSAHQARATNREETQAEQLQLQEEKAGLLRRGKNFSACTVPACDIEACKPHPTIVGSHVCLDHFERIEALAQNSQCGRCDVVQDDGICQGLGCQLGFSRPCALCGISDGSTPCGRTGCTHHLHSECRERVRRRVQLYWKEDKKWYWGTLDDAPRATDESLESTEHVSYDDGIERDEPIVEMKKAGKVIFLLSNDHRASRLPCICSSFASCGSSADATRICSICCNSEADADDGNALVFCGGCDMLVHVFCYGQPRQGDELQCNRTVLERAKYSHESNLQEPSLRR